MLTRFVHLGRKRPERYGDLLIKADPGLHGQVAAKVREHLPEGGRVLDLGCGEGALSARLRDLGYIVTAADIDVESFKADGVSFTQVDFDDDAALSSFVTEHEGAFDAVLGIEVIEHVQDQWRYARQLIRMARPGGLVVVTTPNTASWLSRFRFLISGQFHSFDDHGLSYGHISPISPWELELVLTRSGLLSVTVEPAGTLPPLYLPPNRDGLISLLTLPMRPFMKGIKNGWCVLAAGLRPTEWDPAP